MVGQTELWDRLQLQSFAAMRQRIDIQFRLYHLTPSETEQFMIEHLAYVGVEREIFEESTIDEVSSYSRGAMPVVCGTKWKSHHRRLDGEESN